jgi:tRNA threonylcarbamoyladenosine biosynthesis protein TsaB
MRILGFDTATPATAVALWDERAGLAVEARDDPPAGERPNHTARLMTLIVETLQRGSSSWKEIDRIAVGVGPGTFTGLRIGIATARALGQARGIPLVGVSTLRSIAHGGAASAGEQARSALATPDGVVAAIDARREEVFAAGWLRVELGDPRAAPLLPPAAMRPEALAAAIADGARPVLALGDGAVKFREVLERSGASIPPEDSDLHRVSAINHCRLAVDSGASSPDEIRPEYLRLPDAEISRGRAPTR